MRTLSLLCAFAFWLVVHVAGHGGGTCLLQKQNFVTNRVREDREGSALEGEGAGGHTSGDIGCFRLGKKYCAAAYKKPRGRFGRSRSAAACASECKHNSKCIAFVFGHGARPPCRLSFTCKEALANRQSRLWKAYFPKETCSEPEEQVIATTTHAPATTTRAPATTTKAAATTTRGATTKAATTTEVPATTTSNSIPSPAPADSADEDNIVVEAGGDLHAALKKLEPGKTLVVRGHHDLDGAALKFRRKCSAERPCRIVGEDATLDGSVKLSLKWKQMDAKRNQWSAEVSRSEIWQLWMDEKPLTVARTPNVEAWSKDYWDKKKSFLWVRGSGASTWIEGSKPRPGYDDVFPDSAQQDLEGCVMVINSGSWLSFARHIKKHSGRRVEFSGLPKKLPKAMGKRGVNTVGLFFECGTLLDAPNEWWINKNAEGNHSTITIQLPEGDKPHGKTFRGRVMNTLLSLDRAQHVEVRNLNFFSGTIRLPSSKHVTVEGCSLLYPHQSRRVLKRTSPGFLIDASGVQHLRFQNNIVRYSDGALMSMRASADARIENNEFFMIDLAVTGGLGGTTLDALNNRDFVYRFNTLEYAGSSDNIRYSVVGITDKVGAQAYMNYHSHCGASQTDGATIQIAAGAGPWNNFVHHNWFVNTGRGGMRFDGWQAGQCGIVYKNVAYHTGAWGFRLKGDWHKVLANTDLSTVLDTSGPARDLGPAKAKGKSNGNSFVRNNAARHYNYNGDFIGDTSHNLEGVKVKDCLVDPDGFDFRPKAGKNPLVDAGEVIKDIQMCGKNGAWGSQYDSTSKKLPVDGSYVGAAPDIGAYERGAKSYWIPGRRNELPSFPLPQKEGTVRTDLIWRPACGQFPECLDDELASIKAYHVFAGCPNSRSPDEKVVHTKIGVTRNNLLVSPWIFAFNKPCTWRVDTELSTGKTRKGEIWDFRATWQNCSVEWIPCDTATITYRNSGSINQLFSTGKTAWGAEVDFQHIRNHNTYFMQCTIPGSYAARADEGPLGGRWLEARVNAPYKATLYPVPDAPPWQASNTSGKSAWVLAAEKMIAQSQLKGAAPEGIPMGKKRESKGCSGPVLSGHHVGTTCIRGTTSVAAHTVYSEDYKEWHKKMMLGYHGLPGGIIRPRKRTEKEFIVGPGTYTFAIKSKKSTIYMNGPQKPALGLTICQP